MPRGRNSRSRNIRRAASSRRSFRCCGARRNRTAAGCRRRRSGTSSEMLGMAHIRALEVATFYTMFLLEPCGKKAHVQVCGTTPCMLRGAEAIFDVCQKRIHHDPLHVSADGDFSWEEVECLGACVNAPMVLIWNDTYEDLTAESFEKVLDGFAKGSPAQARPADRPAIVRAGRRRDHVEIGEGLRCSTTRIASSRISTARATGASRARASAAPGTAPRRSWTRAATPSSTRSRPPGCAAAAARASRPA